MFWGVISVVTLYLLRIIKELHKKCLNNQCNLENNHHFFPWECGTDIDFILWVSNCATHKIFHTIFPFFSSLCCCLFYTNYTIDQRWLGSNPPSALTSLSFRCNPLLGVNSVYILFLRYLTRSYFLHNSRCFSSC